ncbi:MAG: sodium:calcium antiporter, partial [Betaproteobacteria bacterium]|nr:sodium:calcium antiporter [Betaproteobacteria bacterium]
MSPSVEVWFELSACASILAVAGFRLSRYGDIIADKSGLSGSWIGLVLLASVTSLPELVTGVSSIVAAQAPNIAVGDVLGSCVFNLAILVVVDILHRPESVYRRTSQGHILSAAFGIVLTGLAGLGILLAGRPVAMAIAHVGAYTPVFLIVYFVAVRSIFDYEREQLREHVADEASRYPDITLRQAAAQYAVAAAAVLAAGIWLPFVGVRLAEAMGWHKSFVGTLFVAGATSLPELV